LLDESSNGKNYTHPERTPYRELNVSRGSLSGLPFAWRLSMEDPAIPLDAAYITAVQRLDAAIEVLFARRSQLSSQAEAAITRHTLHTAHSAAVDTLADQRERILQW
jgi:hypothetical protein